MGNKVALLVLFVIAAVGPQPATAFVASPSPASAGVESNTVVTKVIELLNLLRKQLDEDTKKERAQYNEYASWYGKEKSGIDKVLDEAKQKMEALKTSLAQEAAFYERTRQSLDRAVAEQTGAQKDFQEAEERRKQEKKSFEKAATDLSKAADKLDHALEVLAKQMPKDAAAAVFLEGGDLGPTQSPAAGAAALLAVARNLREILEKGEDFSLSGSQRETLEGLFRIGAARAAAARASDTAKAASPGPTDSPAEPSFLQVRARRAAGGSDFQASAGDLFEQPAGSLISTLQSLLDKTQTQLDTIRKEETRNGATYGKLKEQQTAELKSKEATVADLKMQLAQSEEKTGQQKAQLLAAQQLLTVTQEQLRNVQSEYEMKTASFKERNQKREDEKLAVVEATKILTSQAARELFGTHFQGAAPASFLQLAKASQRNSLEVLRKASLPRISLLSLRMRTRRASMRRRMETTDPFGEVKDLIRSMLKKLENEVAKDTKHADWCDSELGKSVKSKESREADVQKIKDRLEEMDVDISQLKDELKTTAQDLAEMQEATTKATQMRQAEAAKAKATLAEYRDAQKLIKSAMDVLQRYYAQAEGEQAPKKGPKSAYKPSGAGSSVIGILEVAVADYKQLEQELTVSEKVAAKDFNDLMSETKVRMAVFNKDQDYKTRMKVKLEGDRLRASTDLTSYQKELDALNSYLDELKASCTTKGSSYEERRERRDKELQSLREAINVLNGESIA